jgi:4-amino-4-deoxy-L-arabinose transferase-like glycosyltransferase
MSFLTGLLTADWQSTLQTGHPGVTTMWSGSLGLILDYSLGHRAEGTLLSYIQGLSHDPLHIDPTVLPWMRLPIVLLTSLSIPALFWLLRPLDRTIAIIAALLLAFHPIYLGNSQLLHHDALVSVFITLAVILFLVTLRSWSWGGIVFSGVMTGLAILSKSTAYALLPFGGLVLLFEVINRRLVLRQAVWAGLGWSLAALFTVVALWPALWVNPTAVWQTVFGWATQSADAGNLSNTLIPNFNLQFPDLGILFYPINWALKSTPLTVVGLVFFFYKWRKEPKDSLARWWILQLLLWIGLFSLMLSVGNKRDGRYLLPIYFALCILAAFGLRIVYQNLKGAYPLIIGLGSFRTNIPLLVFVVLLLGFSVTYYPYYLAYYNPLIGGPWLAPRLIKVGLGDGMEQAAVWLNSRPNADQLRVATDLEQTFSPLFAGQATEHNIGETFSADYVLNYTRQIQNGIPFAEYWPYYQARPPAFKLKIAGIDYLWLHQEPPLASVGRISFADNLILRAFTIDQQLAAPGTPLNVTLIWRLKSSTDELVRLQLRDETGQAWGQSAPAPVIDPDGPSAVEGHYTLPLPGDIPRGRYSLWATVDNTDEWIEFTTVPVGYMEPTRTISNLIEANFAHRIALRGFGISNDTPTAGETVTLDLHWQALQPMAYAFTNFVHLTDSENRIVAQSDVQPGQGRWPTNTWHPNEWISDRINISLPPDLQPGEYQMLVGWYHLETGQQLPLENASSQNGVILETITVR